MDGCNGAQLSGGVAREVRQPKSVTWLQTYGLAGYQGGKHSGGWGTENYIVPLGEGYLEIAAIFNEEEAKGCDWGRWAHLSIPLPSFTGRHTDTYLQIFKYQQSCFQKTHSYVYFLQLI